MKKLPKHILLEITIVIFGLSVLAWIFIPKFLASQNINTPEHFPDPIFRKSVERALEVEPGGYFTYAQTKKIVDIELTEPVWHTSSWMNNPHRTQFFDKDEKPIEGISDLSALRFFPNLFSVKFFASPRLNHIDFSQNPKIGRIQIHRSTQTFLSFASAPVLRQLNISHGSLREIDVSKNLELMSLSCYANQLRELDVTANHELISLECFGNQLKTLDLSQNKKLSVLHGDYNLLTNLDLSENPNLVTLRCNLNQLSGLDLHVQKQLKSLHCRENGITELDVSNNPKLSRVDCRNNQLTELDFLHNPELEQITIGGNPLSKLDVSNCKKLKTLFIDAWQLFNTDLLLHPDANPKISVDVTNQPLEIWDKCKIHIEEFKTRYPHIYTVELFNGDWGW